MGRNTKGRRVKVEPGVYFPGSRLGAGDYYGPVSNPENYDGRPVVWFLLPGARDKNAVGTARSMRCVASPPHVFKEEPDGSLTIRESILVHGYQNEPDIWHGYLTKGVWEEC